jgi:hypothetical protein
MDCGQLDENPRPDAYQVYAAAVFGLKRWRERLGDLYVRREEVAAVNAIGGLLDQLILALSALEQRNAPDVDDRNWGGFRHRDTRAARKASRWATRQGRDEAVSTERMDG